VASLPLGQYIRKAWQDFSGGLNTQLSPLKVAENQLVSAKNGWINKRGLLETAKGYTLDGSPFPNHLDSFIRLLYNYKKGAAVDKLLVAAQDNGNTDVTYKVDFKESAGDGVYKYITLNTGTATWVNGQAQVDGQGTFWGPTGTGFLKTGDKIKPTTGSVWYSREWYTDNCQPCLCFCHRGG